MADRTQTASTAAAPPASLGVAPTQPERPNIARSPHIDPAPITRPRLGFDPPQDSLTTDSHQGEPFQALSLTNAAPTSPTPPMQPIAPAGGAVGGGPAPVTPPSPTGPGAVAAAAGIRPMTLAPTTSSGPGATLDAQFSNDSGMSLSLTTMSGGGSGGGGSNPEVYINQSGGSDGYQYQEASSSQDGLIVTEIGGHETLIVSAYYSSPIDSVEWQISDVYESYQFDATEGLTTTPLPNPYVAPDGSSSVSFFMSEDPGLYTATAVVSFEDGVQAEATMNLESEQPTVTENSFDRTYRALELQTFISPVTDQPAAIQWNQAEFNNQGQEITPGNYFTAEISTQNMDPNLPGGSVGFFQTVATFNNRGLKDGTTIQLRNVENPVPFADANPNDPQQAPNLYMAKAGPNR